MVATAAIVGIAAPFAIPFALGALGFGGAGVVGGSVAAAVQSGIGNVAAGSAFAAGQSAGAAGVSAATAAATGGTAGAAAGWSTASDATVMASSMFMDVLVPYMFAVVGDWIHGKFYNDD